MKIRKFAPNATEIKNGKFLILVSYETPVAVINTETNKKFQTIEFYSRTTNKHINKWWDFHDTPFVGDVSIISQTEIDGMSQ